MPFKGTKGGDGSVDEVSGCEVDEAIREFVRDEIERNLAVKFRIAKRARCSEQALNEHLRSESCIHCVDLILGTNTRQ